MAVAAGVSTAAQTGSRVQVGEGLRAEAGAAQDPNKLSLPPLPHPQQQLPHQLRLQLPWQLLVWCLVSRVVSSLLLCWQQHLLSSRSRCLESAFSH